MIDNHQQPWWRDLRDFLIFSVCLTAFCVVYAGLLLVLVLIFAGVIR